MSAPQSADQDRDEIELEPSPDGPPPVPRTPPSSASAAADDDGPEPISVTGNLPPRIWPPRTVADLMTRKVITFLKSEPIGDL